MSSDAMAIGAVPTPQFKPKINLARFGMLTFLTSEAMLFAGLISGYIVLRGGAGWVHGYRPEGAPALPWVLTGINTIFLVTSSVTCIIAEGQVVRGKRPTLFLFLTTLLGATFVGIQAHEWLSLYHEHLWFDQTGELIHQGNIYSSNFFVLTGFHGTHVAIGVLMLAICTVMSFFGSFSPKSYTYLDCVALYWHFVDVVWLFLFTILYLL